MRTHVTNTYPYDIFQTLSLLNDPQRFAVKIYSEISYHYITHDDKEKQGEKGTCMFVILIVSLDIAESSKASKPGENM